MWQSWWRAQRRRTSSVVTGSTPARRTTAAAHADSACRRASSSLAPARRRSRITPRPRHAGTGHEAEALPGQAEPLALLDDQGAVGEVDQPVGAELAATAAAKASSRSRRRSRTARRRPGRPAPGAEAGRRRPPRQLGDRCLVEARRPTAAGVRSRSSASQPRSMAIRRRHSSSRTGSTASQAATSAAASCRATSGVPASTVSIERGGRERCGHQGRSVARPRPTATFGGHDRTSTRRSAGARGGGRHPTLRRPGRAHRQRPGHRGAGRPRGARWCAPTATAAPRRRRRRSWRPRAAHATVVVGDVTRRGRLRRHRRGARASRLDGVVLNVGIGRGARWPGRPPRTGT